MDETLTYSGEKLKEGYKELSPYIPNAQLIDAVNLAIYLKRPLLVMGDPGCGKTRLAESVAYDLYGSNYADHFFKWHIKSTTKAKDGLYTYNALDRLRDAQMKDAPAHEIEYYIKPAALGQAYEKSTKEQPAVLLIDEIDKASIDFPNDLLLELESGEYFIEETQTTEKAEHVPITIITSNAEKELPAAFLRRCIYHYIPFPEEEQLRAILNHNFDKGNKKLIDEAVKLFLKVRQEMEAKLSTVEKKVSTSELIDWYKVIDHCYQLKHSGKELNAHEQRLVEQLELLGNDKIPYRQVLLKDFQSHLTIMSDQPNV